jgi:hypothetical protein
MELSLETIILLLQQGIALAYKISPALIYTLILYLIGRVFI